nr:hypothetical protein [Actinomycetota bacterium]
AVAQPRLGVAWFVPLLMYGSEEITNGTTFQNGATIAVAALTVAVALCSPRAAESSLAGRQRALRLAEKST